MSMRRYGQPGGRCSHSKGEVRESMRVQGMTPAPGAPEHFGDLLRTDAARFAKVVRDAKITVD